MIELGKMQLWKLSSLERLKIGNVNGPSHSNGISEEKSVTQLLCEDADPIFPNVCELLCILAVLPIGSAEAE